MTIVPTPAQTTDLASTLARALESAAPVLNRAAIELDALAVDVLLTTGNLVEITYCWSKRGDYAPAGRVSLEAGQLSTLHTRSGSVDSASPLAGFLREWLSQESQSFLLFPWQVRQRVVTVVLCFEAPEPPSPQIPDSIRENLNLIGLATWSVKEIERLQAELQTVTKRLAGRKLVERAKGLLQLEQGLSEERAYEYLRGLSRKRRIALTTVAEEVVRGHNGPAPARCTAS